MSVHSMEELTWPQLRRLGQAGALFLIPVGPIEDHGPHLPSGVDWLTAAAMTADLAERLTSQQPQLDVVVAPCLALGASLLYSLGCLRVPVSTMGEVIEALGRELAGQGVRRAAVITTHGAISHLAALEGACTRVSRTTRMRMYSPCRPLITRFLAGQLRPELERAVGHSLEDDVWAQLATDYHAGAWETSLLLRYRPDLVRDFYDELPPHRVEPSRPLAGLTRHRGYFGSPGLASRKLGDAAAEVLVAEGARLIDQELLQAKAAPANGRRAVRAAALGAGLLLAAGAVGVVLSRRGDQVETA